MNNCAHKYPVLTLDQIRHVHVELTTRCNARCPMCMRNYRGGDYNAGYPITELTLEQFCSILTPEILHSIMQPEPAVNGKPATNYLAQGVTFNGNLGDFALASEGLEIVRYLRQNAVPVVINTNGSLRSQSWWQQLGNMGVTVGFAIDGLEDTHHLYRQDTDWNRIMENARVFIRAGGRAEWRFIAFDHNRHQESVCRDLARDLGFADFDKINDGRDRGPAFTRDGQFSHHIGNLMPTEAAVPPPWQDWLQNHITWYDSRTVQHDRDTPQLNMQCVHKQNREVYIAADGSVYPCCFLGFYPATMTHPGNQELRDLVRGNNALEVGLARAMAWFDSVEDTWQRPSIREGRTYQCVVTCNRA
jgi:MoaA/NifB/PqqE/SkfB family radical SAM enzyme